MQRLSTLVCSALVISLMAMACSNNDTPNTNPTPDQGTVDMTGQDMTKKDMATKDMVDKDTSTSDMPGTDMTGGDMAEKDMLTKDMPADTSEDMVGDMSGDMASDMMNYPDVMEYPCAYPSADPNCDSTGFGPGSYITKLEIVEDTSCCRDFDGDGRPDNFVGASLIRTAKTAFMQDVNANIKKAIELGALIYLIEYRNLGNEAYDPAFSLGLVSGFDTDASLAENTLGTGSFYVTPSSFDLQGLPLYNFPVASVYNYKLVAKEGTMSIAFPGLIDGVDLTLTDVEIKADVKPGAKLDGSGQVALGNGTISGALLRDPLFTSMNAISNRCACLGRDIFTFDANSNSFSCNLTANACEMDPNSDCRNIGERQLCSTLSFISKRADLDVDKDGKNDAYSMGAKFEAVTTTLLRR